MCSIAAGVGGIQARGCGRAWKRSASRRGRMTWHPLTASEHRGNNLKGLEDFCLTARDFYLNVKKVRKKSISGLLPECQGQNLALTISNASDSLDSGRYWGVQGRGCVQAWTRSASRRGRMTWRPRPCAPPDGVSGFGFDVWGVGVGVVGLGSRVEGLGLRFQGLGFRVGGWGFKI